MLAEIEAEIDRYDEAAPRQHEPAVRHVVKQKLAALARAMTRAHSSLIPPSDPRYRAAQTVIGYCDEADAAATPLPPVELGAQAA